MLFCVIVGLQRQTDDSVVSGEAIQTQLNVSQQAKPSEKQGAAGQKKKKGKKKWQWRCS